MKQLTTIREPIPQQIADYFKTLIDEGKETFDSLKKMGPHEIIRQYTPECTGGEIMQAFYVLRNSKNKVYEKTTTRLSAMAMPFLGWM